MPKRIRPKILSLAIIVKPCSDLSVIQIKSVDRMIMFTVVHIRKLVDLYEVYKSIRFCHFCPMAIQSHCHLGYFADNLEFQTA